MRSLDRNRVFDTTELEQLREDTYTVFEQAITVSEQYNEDRNQVMKLFDRVPAEAKISGFPPALPNDFVYPEYADQQKKCNDIFENILCYIPKFDKEAADANEELIRKIKETTREVEELRELLKTGDVRLSVSAFEAKLKQICGPDISEEEKAELNTNKGTGKDGNIDLFKLKPEDVTREIAEWLIANPVNAYIAQHPYEIELILGIVGMPVPVVDLFYAGGFVIDKDGIYHARQEWSLQSFEYSGYNDFYDTVFHYATDMNKAKFQFSDDDGNDYILWAWKGDYLNLGAGAEMGIYKRMVVNGTDTEHWLVDQSLAMPMTLNLDCNGKQIISYDPKKVDPQINDPLSKDTNKWWVTGFNPDYQNVKASQLTATYTATFNTQAMYDDFYNKYGNKYSIYYDSRWTFDPKTITGTLKF